MIQKSEITVFRERTRVQISPFTALLACKLIPQKVYQKENNIHLSQLKNRFLGQEIAEISEYSWRKIRNVYTHCWYTSDRYSTKRNKFRIEMTKSRLPPTVCVLDAYLDCYSGVYLIPTGP